MKRFILLVLLSQLFVVTYGQQWLEKLPQSKDADNLTLYDYQEAFNDYWQPFKVDNKGYYIENGVKKKASGWKQFHRWEWDMEGQIDPKTGAFPEKSAQEIYDAYKKANPNKQGSKAANWSVVGPNSSDGGYAGVGRINCIAFHPSDNDTYWIGAPAGGLWMTTDNGSSWTCLTDNNDVLGVSDIIIPSDYSTSNTIYIATGDRDAWDNRSIGVLKSTNNGASWQNTGLSYSLSDGDMVTRLLLDPADDNTIIAATSNGVFKTTDGGTTWSTQLSTVSFIDMEYKPGDFSTLYGSTTSGYIYVSTNSGSSWNQSSDFGSRIELAVTPANSSIVYAIVAASDNGLESILKSTNSGTSFSVVFDSYNLMGWYDGAVGDAGGQGWYDLSMAVSPNNEDVVLVGGVNTWSSEDGGVNWSLANHWYGGYGAQAVHADKHNLRFRSNGDLFECNDGGIYLSSDDGATWTDKTNGMTISQMYKLGVSQSVSGEVITGLQDNGTKLISSGTWNDVKGGDGMECLIDYSDVNIQYGTYVQGQISRTTDHWVSATDIEPSSGNWVTPYIIDPADPNTIYAGYEEIYKTTDRGDSWTTISSLSSGNFSAMAIAPSNNQVLYVSTGSNIWVTTNGGSNWTNINNTLPLGSSSITYIAVKGDDENTVWVSLSGYNSDNVYESTNGGSSWTNISTGLPSIPAYSIVQNTQSTGSVHLYVGTELGVYFKNGTDNWIEFNTGLPNVKIGELEIYYDATPTNSKLYTATYGRGLWQTTVEQPNIDFPVVTTATPTSITQNSATVGGEVVSEGASALTEKGVVWNLTGNPTISDNKIVEGTTTVEAFTVPMTSLSPAVTYYVKAYATNSYGTAYGSSATFTTDCNVPATQATNFAATIINDTDITITWTSGGDHVIVIAKEGNAVNVDPSNGVSYTANSDFTSGEDLGSGNIAVYSGTDETVTVSNLLQATDYYFAIYKFNDTEKCYNIITPATGNATTTGYCQASGGGICYIDGIHLEDISTVGTGENGYEDYTSLSTDLETGFTYTFTITNGDPNTIDLDLGVWIDFNDNDSFDDAGENVICAPISGAHGDYNLFMPIDANLGSHVMRIRSKYTGDDCGSPCGTMMYGEVEDYTVNIITNILPAVRTSEATNVTVSTATVGGEILDPGTSAVTERGIVWNLTGDPTTSDNKIVEGSVGTGTFTVPMTSLSPSTTYYVKAYAINGTGTSYGPDIYFTTLCEAISSFPYTQDFDNFVVSSGPSCSNSEFDREDCWANDQINDQTDWAPWSGSTASSSTGPSDDVTGGGNYLYTEASNGCTNLLANLFSPVFDFSTTDNQELSFYYHMYGVSMGTLQVDLYYDGTWHNGILASWSGTDATSISGDQGSGWNRAIVDISEADTYTDVQIRISGTTGSGYESDIAIDQFEIKEKYICTPPVTQATGFNTTAINDNNATINWTSGGDRVLVLAKESSAINADPIDGDTYVANSDYSLGENIGSGCIAVYSGTGETVTVTNLNSSTEYYFAVYKYDDATNCYNISSPATGNIITTGYCSSFASNTGDTEIDEVIFNTINENSAGVCASYTDNSSISTDVMQGQIYSLSVTAGTCGGDYSKAVKVFIDWNNDTDFNDIEELAYTSAITNTTSTFITDITVPGIYIGSVRMRVVTMEVGDPASILACGEYSWGETEDYTINILSSDLPLLETKPVSEITNSSATLSGEIFDEGASVVTERGFVYNTTGNPTLTDEVVIEGSTGTGVYTSEVSGLTALTTYYVRAYATNTNGTAYGNEVSFIPKEGDIEVTQVYTLGKLPVDFGTPHVIYALITNVSDIDKSNIEVNLNITGDNPFTDVQNISSLVAGASDTIYFAVYSPTLEGDQLVEVSLPGDDDLSNNILTKEIVTTLNSYSYSQGDNPISSIGFGDGTSGDFVAKFSTAISGVLNQFDVEFAAEGIDFQVVVFDATGVDGVPGTLLYVSSTQVTSIGNYTLLIDPGVSISVGDFYVGIRQINNNVRFGYQVENPIRKNVFYINFSPGSSDWIDVAPSYPTRLMIEPKFATSNDVAAVSASAATGIIGQPVDINVEVINYGSNSQSDVPVYYTVNMGNEVGPLTISGPIEMNATETDVFENALAYYPTTYGMHQADVYTKMDNDQVDENNLTTCYFNVLQPEIIITDVLSNFGDVQLGSVSAVQSYSVSGNYLYEDVVVTAPAGFEISLTNSDYSVNPITLNQIGGTLSPKTVYVRFAPDTEQAYSNLITHASGQATQVNVAVAGNGVVTPVIVSSISNIDFGEVETATSVVQSYTIEGANLTNDIVITAPAGLEISLDNADFSVNPITLTQTGGVVSKTNIYVRFTPTLEQLYNLDIVHTSTGASQLDVAVSGTGVAPGTPIITTSATSFDFGEITTNTISTEQTYSISGSNLTDNIVITAPSGFEISLDNSDYSVNPITLSQSGGAVSNTTIYVQFAPESPILYSSNISHESTGVTTKSISVSGSAICDVLNIVSSSNDQTLCEGETATFTVLVTGTENISYAWKKGIAVVSDGGDVSGASTNTLTVANVESFDAGTYTCEISDACGNTESAQSILTVNTNPIITKDPVSITICEGEEAVFTITATGTGLSYQWKKGTENVGTDSPILTLASALISDAADYTCVVNGTCGNPVTTSMATLTVNTEPVITTEPLSVAVCDGDLAEFSVIATGTGLSYQWKKGANNTGTDSPTLSIASVTSSDVADYTCVISGTCGDPVTSEVASLAINSEPLIVTEPASITVCEGDAAEFTIAATGTGLSYQWKKGANNTGTDSPTLSIASVTSSDVADYTCEISGTCGSVESNIANLSVKTATQISTQPTDINATVGDDITFSVVADGENLVYQWRFDETDINGATEDSYQILSVIKDNAGEYTVKVSGDCGDVTSEIANLSVTTSIQELSELGIKVYPNPSEGIFNVQYSNLDKAVEVLIYSLDGKVVYNEKHFSQMNMIDISDKAKGMYIVRFNFEDHSIVSNIVLK